MLAHHQQPLSSGQRSRRSQLIPRSLPAALAIAIGLTFATTGAPAGAAPGVEAQPPGEPAPSSSPPPAPPPVGADVATSPQPAAGAAQTLPAPVATTPTIPPVTAPPAAQVDEEESLRAFADEGPQPRTRLGTAAWIGAGVTVALLGVAAFYGAKASDKASDVDRLLRSFDQTTDIPVEYASVAAQYESDVREGKHDDRVAKGFAIAAGAAAVTTAALFVIDAVRGPTPAMEKVHAAVLPMGTPRGAGMSIGWTF